MPSVTESPNTNASRAIILSGDRSGTAEDNNENLRGRSASPRVVEAGVSGDTGSDEPSEAMIPVISNGDEAMIVSQALCAAAAAHIRDGGRRYVSKCAVTLRLLPGIINSKSRRRRRHRFPARFAILSYELWLHSILAVRMLKLGHQRV